MTFDSNARSKFLFTEMGNRNIGLLYIKAPFLESEPGFASITSYLRETKETITGGISIVNDGGFIVIQTQDIRIDGYIEPLAKTLVDTIVFKELWLREVVVVTHEGSNSKAQDLDKYLEITHKYLLVYEVTK